MPVTYSVWDLTADEPVVIGVDRSTADAEATRLTEEAQKLDRATDGRLIPAAGHLGEPRRYDVLFHGVTADQPVEVH